MKRLQPAIAVFALVLIGIGIWGLAQGTFVAIWAPGIRPAGFRAPMINACSLISLGGGAGLVSARHARFAALLLLVFLCVWLIWCKGPALVHSPLVVGSWESLGETAVILSAAWALAGPGAQTDRRFNGIRENGPRMLYGFALILFGLAHLAYVTLTASLVPAWLPWHVAWVYLTAATYLAAGTACLADRLSRPAAALAALQMALFSALVWLPALVAGAHDADTLNETVISIALAASGWVVATNIKGRSFAIGAKRHGLIPAPGESC